MSTFITSHYLPFLKFYVLSKFQLHKTVLTAVVTTGLFFEQDGTSESLVFWDIFTCKDSTFS